MNFLIIHQHPISILLKKYSTKSHVLSTHMLPHLRERDGDLSTYSHRLTKLYVADG